MLLINCSNREKNCYKILNDIRGEDDKFLSLSNKQMNFCLGCNSCEENIDNYCVLDDYITNEVYPKIINENDIVFASPLYISNINGILKNLIDRMNPFYHHELLKGKNIYLILTGQGSREGNSDEINGIIEYFNGISEWLYFKFEFLDYFQGYDDFDAEINYADKIEKIKERLNK